MTRKDVQTRSQLQLPHLSAELTAVVNDTWTWRPSSVSEAVRNDAHKSLARLNDDNRLAPVGRDALGAELRRLFTVFWDRRPEQHWQALMQSYAEVIDHYPEAVIRAGVDECIRTATYLPKPAELRAACKSAMPEDYQKAYALRARLEAISRAPVAVAFSPLSDAEKQQIADVIQEVTARFRLPSGGQSC